MGGTVFVQRLLCCLRYFYAFPTRRLGHYDQRHRGRAIHLRLV